MQVCFFNQLLLLEPELADSKKDEKKGKKKEQKFQREAIFSSLKLESYNNKIITWITSILQTILDQNISDIESHGSLLSKIFPQQDEYPVINPNGKYLIQLNYLGFLYKVEIDDYFPIDVFTGKSLFPLT